MDRFEQKTMRSSRYLVSRKECQCNIARRSAANLTASCVTVGVVFQQFGYHVTPRVATCDGRRSLDAALPLASQAFCIDHVVIVRACGGSYCYDRPIGPYKRRGIDVASRCGCGCGCTLHTGRLGFNSAISCYWLMNCRR